MPQNNMQNSQPNNIKRYFKPVLAGILGMLGLIAVYALTMYLATRNMNAVLEQFLYFKYWIIALVIGFGLQMGLFWYIRSGLHLTDASSKTAVATGAGISAASMVACCAHHLVDILPILGLAAASLFLIKYQSYFFLLGVLSNVGGIILMIYIIRTKSCPDFKMFFKKLFRIKNK